MLGVAVVGPGRAGRARIAALDGHPGARLAAVVSRARPPSFGQVLADSAVDAVIVCTPNGLHAEQARAALEAGKHVAVEFPLACTPGQARELFEIAAARRLVLHVEHIELLSASQRLQRERARGLGRPLRGELRFTGSNAGWIGDLDLSGSPALHAVARLHRLLDLFGSAQVAQAELVRQESGYELRAALRFAEGGGVRLVETRAARLARATRWSIECERGRLDDPAAEPERGLFLRDLDHFLERIASGADPYVPDARVVEVLELVAAIERACA